MIKLVKIASLNFVYQIKKGYGLPLIIFSGCILMGNAIIYAGVRLPNVIVILVGRFIFGLGGESLIITQGALLIYWFKGKELGFSQVILCLKSAR